MALEKQQVTDALRSVIDPALGRDIVTLGRVRHVAVCDGVVSISVEAGKIPADQREGFKKQVHTAASALDGANQVDVELVASLGGEPTASGGAAAASGDDQNSSDVLPNVKHIIAVGAGKGGVGKSTVAVNLAVGLARAGQSVGLMDGDIYGPSLPTMLALDQLQPKAQGNMILPFEVHGIKAVSIGSLVEQDKPLIWRGPMAHGAFRQLITQTLWGELDVLVIDLPPGTGDVPLTMAQLLPLTGAMIVCTPQKVAQDDARRAVGMFKQLDVDVLGIVENMSYFIGDDGKEYDIFGKGGAAMMAQQLGLPLLGQIPISTGLRAAGDSGDPTANFTTDDQLAAELQTLVKRTAEQITSRAMDQGSSAPSLSIH